MRGEPSAVLDIFKPLTGMATGEYLLSKAHRTANRDNDRLTKDGDFINLTGNKGMLKLGTVGNH